MQKANVTETKEFTDGAVKKVTYIKTDKLTEDTYYFNAGQVLAYHKHPTGDQIFFVQEGTGTYYLDADEGEETTELKPGVAVLAPKDKWHKIVADTELVVSQATVQPAGLVQRD
ncbi:MAG: cupin domain-containing protein [Thermodesulfobacteriota bacterium]